jgi:hypothetical protein
MNDLVENKWDIRMTDTPSVEVSGEYWGNNSDKLPPFKAKPQYLQQWIYIRLLESFVIRGAFTGGLDDKTFETFTRRP